MKIFHFITDIFNVSVKANRIKNDEVLRQKSARFAVTASIYSIVAVVFAVGGALLFSAFSSQDGLAVIAAYVFAGVFVLVAAASLVGAIVRLIAQFTINRSVYSWLALILFLAAIAAIAVSFIILL